MAIIFLTAWNGYDEGQRVTLSGAEEARLIAARIAAVDAPLPSEPSGTGAPASGAGNTPTLVAFSTAIPLDATKRMPPTQVAGALTFAVSGTPAAGGICTLKLTANGVNIPVFPGIHWGGSAGWVNTAGTVNIVSVWNDGDATYYSIAQHQSAPITLPSLTVALKSGASSPSTLALSMSSALGNSGSVDASQFAVTTTNGGAQTDNVVSASVSGAIVTLGLSRPATVGDITVVSYIPSATAGLRLVDAAGNYIYSLTGAPVVVQTFAGLLDGLGVSAAGAWSLRRLTSSYTGPLIRVTGSVQGAFNVGFNAATGDLDMTRLTGASGETYALNTVYDQSGGGRDQLATTFSGPPLLALTGGPRSALPVAIQMTAGARIYFTGTNLEAVYLTAGRQGSQFVAMDHANSNFFVGSVGGSDNSQTNKWDVNYTIDSANTPNIIISATAPNNVGGIVATPGVSVISTITQASNASATRLVRTSAGSRQIVTSISNTASTTVSGQTRWGFFNGSGNGVNNRFFEQLQFATGVSSSVRDAVEDNMRGYWGI